MIQLRDVGHSSAVIHCKVAKSGDFNSLIGHILTENGFEGGTFRAVRKFLFGLSC